MFTVEQYLQASKLTRQDLACSILVILFNLLIRLYSSVLFRIYQHDGFCQM